MEKFAISNSGNPRLAWVDWMKTLAMYSIIAGHCNVPGNKFIYVFSVPCFFILSGYLSKKEATAKIFWQKTWWNLIVPMSLLFLVNVFFSAINLMVKGNFDANFLWQMPLNGLLGRQGRDMSAGGLGVLWFVYTLVICKFIFQFTPAKAERWLLSIICVIMLVGAVLINVNHIRIYSSWANVLLSMPFFVLGYFLGAFKNDLNKLGRSWLVFTLIIGAIGVWGCGTCNDIVMLFRCSYGSSLALCVIGALCGTSFLFALSRLLESFLVDVVRIVGGGTLIILGLHYFLGAYLYVTLRKHFLPMPPWFLYIDSLILLLSFIPIIMFCERHLPILYGKQRKHH